MNIKTFIEDSEREFDEKFNNTKWPHHDLGADYKPWPIHTRAFMSQKLRELIGEVKAEVEGMKKLVNNGEVLPFENSPEIYGNKRIEAYKNGFNLALDSLLQLLDEIK